MWTADEIARLCYEHYRISLPKQGKPEPNREWTLLAAVVKIQPIADQTWDSPDKLVRGEILSVWNAHSLSEMAELYVALQGWLWSGINYGVVHVSLLSTRWCNT